MPLAIPWWWRAPLLGTLAGKGMGGPISKMSRHWWCDVFPDPPGTLAWTVCASLLHRDSRWSGKPLLIVCSRRTCNNPLPEAHCLLEESTRDHSLATHCGHVLGASRISCQICLHSYFLHCHQRQLSTVLQTTITSTLRSHTIPLEQLFNCALKESSGV